MKKILKYALLVSMPAFVVMSCAPAEEEKSGLGAIADINSVQYSIVTDTEDGSIMHFNILTPGVVGIWEFESPASVKIGVDIKQGFPMAGAYAVNLSVYNKGGISSQSKRVEFDVPEDSPTLIAAVNLLTAKPWVWDNQEAGHIGNGPERDTTPSWWVAGPNEQSPRVYDDTLYFHANGKNPTGAYQLVTLDSVLCNEGAAAEFGIEGATAGVLVSYTQPAGQNWILELEGDNKYLRFTNNGFPSYIPNSGWGNNKYTIIRLDENILSIRIDLGWGAFYMRFTHPS
ncbi:MAG: hypothetical protein LBK47_04530 [Prevotellaceae bacterium]|jgi:hypothetical protein|nr:hypothetical protein [Prevotellaceae bacterium]